MGTMVNLQDFDLDDLTQLMSDFGQPPYRARQIWNWLYQRYASDYSSMTDLPHSLRMALDQKAPFASWFPITKQHSKDGQTEKLLFQLADGNYIETVLMCYDKRRTLCISTQAGCAMGCVFCATGQMGFQRNLTVSEIIGQVIYFARELAKKEERVSNVVMMGMGEPLHNYQNTLKAVDILTDGDGFGLGARKVTISTVGLVPAIRRFADEKRQTGLAVSLHAATDRERDELIPINRRWPIADLIEACRYYIAQTGRRITFEWALIKGKNDTIEQAQLLGRLIEGMVCHVNLIPLNLTSGFGGRPSDPERVAAFQKQLDAYGISSSVRVRRGIDIQAGCGQLRTRIVESTRTNLSEIG